MTIARIENWRTKTDAAVLAELQEIVGEQTNDLVTLAIVKDAVPPEHWPKVRLTLADAAVPADDSDASRMLAEEMGDALAPMRQGGITLSPPDRQAMVDYLAMRGQWPDAVRDAVKSLGVRRSPRWESLGIATAPTLESIAAFRALDSAERRAEAARIAAVESHNAGANALAINDAAEAAWAVGAV